MQEMKQASDLLLHASSNLSLNLDDIEMMAQLGCN